MENYTNGSTWAQGFLMGLVVGGAGGAALALLYTPSSGRDMREYLASRARDGRERATAAMERGKEIVSESRGAIDEGRELLSTAIAEGREAYRETKARDAL